MLINWKIPDLFNGSLPFMRYYLKSTWSVKSFRNKKNCKLEVLQIWLEVLGVFLENMRSEKKLNSVKNCCKRASWKLKSNPEFEGKIHVRLRKVKKNKTKTKIKARKISYEVIFVYKVLDAIIASLTERFKLIENHSGSFKFHYDVAGISRQFIWQLDMTMILLSHHRCSKKSLSCITKTPS